jgi:spermidine synthase
VARALFTVGLVSTLGQVVLLRELHVAFFGVELIYVLAIGVWLVGSAAGAATGRRKGHPPVGRIHRLLLVLGLMIPLDIVFLRAMRELFTGVRGAYLSFPTQLAGLLLALLPVALPLGLLFQWCARRYIAPRRSVALAYAIESGGAVLGGAIATLSLVWGVSNVGLGLFCGAASAGSVVAGARERTRRTDRAAALALALLLFAGLPLAPAIDHALTGINHPALAATRDTPYGRVTVTELSGQISVFENDALSFDTEGTAAEEFVHLALLQHPSPRRILILGGGVEGLVREARKHGTISIEYIELNGALLETVGSRLPDDIRGSLEAPGVRIRVGDPRRLLDPDGSRDVILIGMPEPASGQTNRFYTREFFIRCRGALAPDGVLAFRLRAAENFWSPQLARRTASIHRALADVFPETLVLPGSTITMLASRRPLAEDPADLIRRFGERRIEARLISPPYLRFIYENDRREEIERLVAAPDVPMNRDAHPVCYQYATLVWLSKFFPVLAWLDVATASGRGGVGLAWVLSAVVALVFIGSRRFALGRRALFAGTAGFVGMLLETVLLMAYQSTHGALYRDIGLLLTLFMAGLGTGAVAAGRAAGPVAAGRVTGLRIVAGFAAVALASIGLLRGAVPPGIITTAVLLFATGALVAGAFVLATMRTGLDQRRVVGPFYAADLFGGALASVAGSLLLIPGVGLVGSALVAGAVAALAVLLVL